MNRVLIVEDDLAMCQFYGRILEQSGLSVTYASTCQHALDYLYEEIPYLVLLDMALPDRCGQAVIDYIKSRPAMSLVHIVVISSNGDYKNRNLMANVDQFIVKPISPRVLLDMLQELGVTTITM